MTRTVVMAVVLALMGADAAVAAEWQRSTLPGPVDYLHGAAPGLPGEAVVLHRGSGRLSATTFAPGSTEPVTSPVMGGLNFYPVVAGSTTGGTCRWAGPS